MRSERDHFLGSAPVQRRGIRFFRGVERSVADSALKQPSFRRERKPRMKNAAMIHASLLVLALAAAPIRSAQAESPTVTVVTPGELEVPPAGAVVSPDPPEVVIGGQVVMRIRTG